MENMVASKPGIPTTEIIDHILELSEKKNEPPLLSFLFRNSKLYIPPPPSSEEYGKEGDDLAPGALRLQQARINAIFAGAEVVTGMQKFEEEGGISHVVVGDTEIGTAPYAAADNTEKMEIDGEQSEVTAEMRRRRAKQARDIRKKFSSWEKVPRVVGVEWVEECWKEGTLLDEERFAVY